MKAKADGSEGQTLVDGLNDPRTIVQDEEMFLYWVDVATSSVGRIRTDGSMEEELFNHNVFTGVHSFVLDSFTYYWSRPADKDIIDVDRHNPNLIGTLSVKDAVTMEGLYYFKSDQPIARK
ncbi:hypothetical protein HOLleu_29425 [Holothuria leucospilota]|uniref:Uncharacterized protein n=1 Tax=Holothuria leucospilota TaxID=206669 RepID=A0A9Q1BNX0_HOLLE|nr:hypothetical protein HOLleu_29425 [Holothuria leucospilota]